MKYDKKQGSKQLEEDEKERRNEMNKGRKESKAKSKQQKKETNKEISQQEAKQRRRYQTKQIINSKLRCGCFMGSRKKQQLLNIKIPQNKNKLQNYTHIANIIDNIYLSDYNTAQDIQVLSLFKITHIINCSPQNCINHFENKIQYLNVEILDEWEANLIENMDAIFKFIQKSQKQNGRILIHCYRGISRSPSVVIAYIIKNLNINENQALKYCKSRYQQAEPNASFMIQLQQFFKQQQENQKLHIQQQQFQDIQKATNNVNNNYEIQSTDNFQLQQSNHTHQTKIPNSQDISFSKNTPFNLLNFQQSKPLFQNIDQSRQILLQQPIQNTPLDIINLQQNTQQHSLQHHQQSILNNWRHSQSNQDYSSVLNHLSTQTKSTNDYRIPNNEDLANKNECNQMNNYTESITQQANQLNHIDNENKQNISLNQTSQNFSKNNNIYYIKGKTQIEQFSDQSLDNVQTQWNNNNNSFNIQSHNDVNFRHYFSASCQDYSQLVQNTSVNIESKFFRHSYHGDINSMKNYIIESQANPTHSQPSQQTVGKEDDENKQGFENQIQKNNNIIINSNEELDSNCSIYAQSDKCNKQLKNISENQTQNNQNGFQSDSFVSENPFTDSNSANQQRELRNSNQSNVSTTNNNETSFCSINHEKKYYNDYFYDDVDETLFGSWPQKKIRLEQH